MQQKLNVCLQKRLAHCHGLDGSRLDAATQGWLLSCSVGAAKQPSFELATAGLHSKSSAWPQESNDAACQHGVLKYEIAIPAMGVELGGPSSRTPPMAVCANTCRHVAGGARSDHQLQPGSAPRE